MIFVVFLFGFVVFTESRPWEEGVYPQNVVTVPPNCPTGQEWVNGQCRDVWRGINPANIVTVPPNCPVGQVFVNGQCRPIWRNIPDQQYVFNADDSRVFWPQNVITVPPNCPPGQAWVNGACRDVWRPAETPRNTVTVPPNCRADQEYFNGECRDVWARSSNLFSKLIGLENFNLTKNKMQMDPVEENVETDPRNVINVPNQCPAGFRPDALGVCREIFNSTNIVYNNM